MIEWALLSYHDHCKSVSLIWIFVDVWCARVFNLIYKSEIENSNISENSVNDD
jgi:hypothetical protein